MSAIRFKNSPLGITANKLNKAFLQSGGGTGSGDMTKAVYDADGNGIVDTADAIPWAKVTGKPTALGDMTRAVYDTNNDGISDHAALADSATTAAAVPWAGVTGKPATFPPDATAMLKATYDANGDGITDHAALADTATSATSAATAAAVPWTGVTGKPSTFPPDSTAMLKATYDANGNGKVDGAETADAAPWAGITGKPATFPPDSTAMLKTVYDVNADGVTDHAALADSVPWAGITGKPALTDPGVWTALSVYQTGWSESATARYRLETRSSGDKAVFFKGAIVKALASSAILALVLPSTLRPIQTRACMVAGAQTEDGGDFCNYIVTIYTTGNVEIRPLVKYPFTWTILTDTHTVYLDGLKYEL